MISPGRQHRSTRITSAAADILQTRTRSRATVIPFPTRATDCPRHSARRARVAGVAVIALVGTLSAASMSILRSDTPAPPLQGDAGTPEHLTDPAEQLAPGRRGDREVVIPAAIDIPVDVSQPTVFGDMQRTPTGGPREAPVQEDEPDRQPQVPPHAEPGLQQEQQPRAESGVEKEPEPEPDPEPSPPDTRPTPGDGGEESSCPASERARADLPDNACGQSASNRPDHPAAGTTRRPGLIEGAIAASTAALISLSSSLTRWP